MRRVVIVDDNEITRTGSARLLESHPEIDVTGAIDHTRALVWDREWLDADAVIVDAADATRAGDQFPGVEVVRRVRLSTGDRRPTVIVLTGHFLDDALRRRMWEADADFFYSRTEVTTAETLQALVLHPDHARRVASPTDPDELAALGVVPASEVNAFVRHVEVHGLGPVLDADARMKQGPRAERSRWWQQVRRSLAEAGSIEPVNVDGEAPRRDQALPSIAQLRRVYVWATKTKRAEP